MERVTDKAGLCNGNTNTRSGRRKWELSANNKGGQCRVQCLMNRGSRNAAELPRAWGIPSRLACGVQSYYSVPPENLNIDISHVTSVKVKNIKRNRLKHKIWLQIVHVCPTIHHRVLCLTRRPEDTYPDGLCTPPKRVNPARKYRAAQHQLAIYIQFSPPNSAANLS